MENKFNFTEARIKNIEPPITKKRLYLYDTKVPGLELMVTANGTKSFKVYKKLNKKPIRYTIGRHPQISLIFAREQAIEILAQINRGQNPNIEKHQIRSSDTIGTMCIKYIDEHAKKHTKRWKTVQELLQNHLKSLWNNPFSDIDSHKLNKLHTKITTESGKIVANRVIEKLRAIFYYHNCATNPAKDITLHREISRERFVGKKELPFLFAALEDEPNTDITDLIYILLFTGQRKSNVLSMKWSEVDLESGIWKIPETKNGEGLSVMLSEPALRILEKRKISAQKKWVFPSKINNDHIKNPHEIWKRIKTDATLKFLGDREDYKPLISEAIELCPSHPSFETIYIKLQELAKSKDIELPTALMDLRIHDLRRTLGSFQAMHGASQYVIGKSLGHKSQAATAIYARMDFDPVRESVNLAGQAMIASAKGTNDEEI